MSTDVKIGKVVQLDNIVEGNFGRHYRQRSVYSAWPSFEHAIVHEPKSNLTNRSSIELIPGHALYILLCVRRWVIISRSTSTSHALSDLWRVRRPCSLTFSVYLALALEGRSAAGNVRAVGFPFPRASAKEIRRWRTT